jgi:methyl-accepting chemotaxis protein
MKNWTIGKRITAGFACLIFIGLVLGAFTYARLSAIKAHSDHISRRAIPIVEICGRVQRKAEYNLRTIYKLVSSTDQADRARLEGDIKATMAENTKAYDDLERLVKSPSGCELLDKTKAARAVYGRVRDAVFLLSHQNTTNASAYRLARTQMDPACERYIAALGALMDCSKAESDAGTKAIEVAVLSSQRSALAGLGLSMVVGVGVAVSIIRGTTKALSQVAIALDDGAAQVASAASQLSSTSQTLAEGASEQAASLEETSASLEELSSMTQRNAENSQRANDLSKQARSAAETGAADMQAMSAAMSAMKTSSDDIAKIIKTIDEIAFQTNILALNAAVEAARAGEAGMGFAVVADEVRNLSQRCAQAAQETAAKIEGAITRTSQGTDLCAKVSQVLGEILTRARQVDELASEVAGASREQSQGFTQINIGVGQMDKVTQGNAATAEESAAAAEQLNAQSKAMRHSVRELLALVGSNVNPEPAKETGDFHPEASPARRPDPEPATLRSNGHRLMTATRRSAAWAAIGPVEHNGHGDIPLVDALKEA